MKNFEELMVKEISVYEMEHINGGGWVKDAWNAVVDALESADRWLKSKGVDMEIGRV